MHHHTFLPLLLAFTSLPVLAFPPPPTDLAPSLTFPRPFPLLPREGPYTNQTHASNSENCDKDSLAPASDIAAAAAVPAPTVALTNTNTTTTKDTTTGTNDEEDCDEEDEDWSNPTTTTATPKPTLTSVVSGNGDGGNATEVKTNGTVPALAEGGVARVSIRIGGVVLMVGVTAVVGGL